MMAFMKRERGWLPAGLGVAVLLLAGCGASGGQPAAGSGPLASTSAGPARSQPAAGTGAGSASAGATAGAHDTGVPRPAHTVVVIMENSSYADIAASTADPYINQLARRGALFTQSYAITHPSEPNYLALFSGSTQGVTDDSCPLTFAGANLASELLAAGFSFAGYSESLPAA